MYALMTMQSSGSGLTTDEQDELTKLIELDNVPEEEVDDEEDSEVE